MRRPEIIKIAIAPSHVRAGEKIKIAVEVKDVVIPTAEPRMYALPFMLGGNQGGNF